MIVFLGWYLTSPHFHDWARRRLVSRLEAMTGGHVELGRFDWNLSKLEFDVHDLTIHGLEEPNEVPYAHADRVLIDARIVSLFRKEIALDRVEVEHPVFHLIVYPDGHTNQPRPKAESTGSATQSLFDLAIGHAELRNGQLILNQTTVPVDVSANDLQLGMKYVPSKDRYDGELKVSVEQARYAKYLSANASVDVAFSLLANELDVNGLHLMSGNSKADASGKLVDFNNPSGTFTYRASVDAAQIARIMRVPELRRGQADLKGELQYSQGKLTTSGKLVARNVEYRAPEIYLTGVDAAGDYFVDNSKLSITRLVSRVAGGIAKGDIAVVWAGNPVPGTKGVPEQTGTVRLSLDNVPVAMAAQALSSPQLRLTQLHPVGTGRGALNARWRGSVARAVLDLDVSVIPPQAVGPSETQIAGNLKGSYDLASQRLRAQALNVNLPTLTLSANGTLGSERDVLHLSVGITDLSSLKPLLTTVNQENSKAADLAGRLHFDGTLSGRIAVPSIAGHVQVSDLTFPLNAIWTPPPPLEVVSTSAPRQPRPKYIHIDSGTADIAYSPNNLTIRNGVIRRAGAQAQIDFNTGLTRGEFTDASPVSLHLAIRDGSIADLQQIAGYDYPISGKLATDLSIHGTRLNLQGGGHVQIADALVYGQTVQSASADVRFVNEEAQIHNLVLRHEQAQVTGSGAYNLKSETYTFQLGGSNFELSTIPWLNNNRLAVSGRLNFNASGTGTRSAPVINASARLRNVVVTGQRVGDARLLAVTQGETLHVTAHSNFQTAEV
ncbi:MAG TPA: hypothetical protein VG897_16380, partial [Terriglobales bacterium]|nr:hypothetical protein [Terriglobales bacterium]